MNEKQFFNFSYDIYRNTAGNVIVEATNEHIEMIIFLIKSNYQGEFLYTVNKRTFKSRKYSIPLSGKSLKKYNDIYEQMKILMLFADNNAEVRINTNFDTVEDIKFRFLNYTSSPNHYTNIQNYNWSPWSYNNLSPWSYQNWYTIDNNIIENYKESTYKYVLENGIFDYETNKKMASCYKALNNKNDEDYIILPKIKYDIENKNIEFDFDFEETISEDINNQGGDLYNSNNKTTRFRDKNYYFV